MRLLAICRCFARPPWPALFSASLLGLLLCVASMQHEATAHRHELMLRTMRLEDWVLMLFAMMPPLIAAPLQHVSASSLRQRRVRAMLCFLVGYGAVWTIAGVPLLALAELLQQLAGNGALEVALALALVWMISPWQQIALNRCHRLLRIGALGGSADRDCLRFGVVQGSWCAASCWAWMLVPFLAGRLHVVSMVAVGALMFAARLGRPKPPHWRLALLKIATFEGFTLVKAT